MRLHGFEIAEDFITLRHAGGVLDLHNDFDFRALRQDVRDATVSLLWHRCDTGDGAPLPATVELGFSQVGLLRITPRDPDMPFSEDACLDMMGFLWNDTPDDDTNGCASVVPSAECDHFCALFLGGTRIRIAAASATLRLGDAHAGSAPPG